MNDTSVWLAHRHGAPPEPLELDEHAHAAATFMPMPKSGKSFETFWARLFRAFDIHAKAAQGALPLYQESVRVLQDVRDGDVVSLGCDTGSGKSTLLPVLLLAEGYTSVLVTQPRRLPCMQVNDRVESLFGAVTGWRVAGEQHNADRSLIFETDGLLWAWLQHIDSAEKLPEVIMLDEVHERSLYIDHCIAKIGQLIERPGARRLLPKLILASATIDEQVAAPFRTMPHVRLKESRVKVPSPFAIVKESRSDSNCVELVVEIFKNLKYDQQILCFLPSTKAVRDACRVRTAQELLTLVCTL